MDIIQGNSCTIAECVNVWKILVDELKDQPNNVQEKVKYRMKQAITPFHLIANIIDPRYGRIIQFWYGPIIQFIADSCCIKCWS